MLLRFHCADDGMLWYGDDRHLAESSQLPAIPRIFQAGVLPFDVARSSGVRLLGTRANAGLIVSLWLANPRVPICLCSPATCPTESMRHDPVVVLQQLLQPEVTGRLAGWWHLMTLDDYHAYNFIAKLDTNGGAVDSVITALLAGHPAWPALSYLNGPCANSIIDVSAACALLATVVDPRWFRHPFRPHRMSRLRAYLGLEPGNVRAVLGLGPPGRHHDRAVTAISTWYNPVALETCGAGRCIDPHHFLWKIFLTQRTAVRGVLRSTEKMLDFLVQVWTGRVARRCPEVGFSSQFYLRSGEHETYVRHLAGQ